MEDVVGFYRSLGVSEAELEQNRVIMAGMLEMMKMILPAGMVMASFADTFVNFWIAKKILRRLGTYIPDLPAFRELLLPQSILLFYGLSLLVLYLCREQQQLAGWFRLAVNFNMLCTVPILLQGLAVCWFNIHKRNWPGFLRGILLACLFTIQFMPLLMIFLGMADFVMDFRKLRHPH